MISIASMLAGFVIMVIAGATRQHDLLVLAFLMEVGIYVSTKNAERRDK